MYETHKVKKEIRGSTQSFGIDHASSTDLFSQSSYYAMRSDTSCIVIYRQFNIIFFIFNNLLLLFFFFRFFNGFFIQIFLNVILIDKCYKNFLIDVK